MRKGNSGRPSALVPALLVALFALGGAAFPAFAQTGADLYGMLEPDLVGLPRFVERIEAVRRGGREPFGLVLSGGLARSFAHIGLLAVLEEKGMVPDFIVGDSLGGVIGLLYAAGLSPASLSALARELVNDDLFDFVLPTSGGFLHASRFASLLGFLTGNPDIADLPIPVMVIADDLKTGRQVRIAQGRLAEVAIASIALPAIFEPVSLDGRLLVDGGSTDLIPYAVAREYSGKVIVSATLHGARGGLSGLLGILMRTFDSTLVGKAMRTLTDLRPPVVWNDVELISNLAFADALAIAGIGEHSARETDWLDLLAEESAALAAGGPGTAGGAELGTARSGIEARFPSSYNAVERGMKPRGGEGMRLRISFNVADPWRTGLLPEEGRRYAKLDLTRSDGWSASSLGFLAGWSGSGARIAAASGGIALNPVDALVFEVGMRMWVPASAADGAAGGAVEATGGAEAGASLSWRFGDPGFGFTPWMRFVAVAGAPVGSTDSTEWELAGGGTVSVSAIPPFFPTHPHTGPKPAEGKDFRAEFAGGWYARSGGRAGSPSGPEIGLRGHFRPAPGWKFEALGAGRADLSGSAATLPDKGLYRGVPELPAGRAVLSAGMDFAWNDPSVSLDLGDAFVLRDISFGPYIDAAWSLEDAAPGGSSGNGVHSASAVGACLSFTASLMGLLPFDLAAFAGVDLAGKPVLGLRSGKRF